MENTTPKTAPFYRCAPYGYAVSNALDAHPRACLSPAQSAELQGQDIALECKNHGEAWEEVGYFKWDTRFEDWLPFPDFGARKEVSDANH